MKLKTHLRASSLEKLQSVARFWELLPPEPEIADNPEALAEHLYPRMQTPSNFRAAFDKLDGNQRDWVYLLSLHGGELSAEEFRRRGKLATPDEAAQVVASMSDRGFIWREKVRDPLLHLDLVGVPEPFVRLIDLPPYWQGFLGFYLQALGTDELKALVRNTFDQNVPTRKKQVLVHYLRKKLLDPTGLEQVLASRDPLQLEMFNQILQKNGMCAWKDLLDSGVHKKFDHARAERLRNLVEQSALVFVLRAGANKYNNLLLVPRDMAWTLQNGNRRDDRTLDQLSHTAADSPASDATPRPGVILDNSNNILRDLVIVCAYIQCNPVKMLNNGGLGRNDLKKIAPLLSHNKTIKYVAFLTLFAMVRKLIIPVGEHWRVSSSFPHWLQRGQGCYRELLEYWLSTNEWNEEYVDGDVMHADNYPQNLISITELRKLMLRMLERTPTETWIDFETFAQSLLPQIAIEIPGRFDLTPADKFNRHPLLIMESMLAESLYWLGIVVLGVADLEVARRLGSRPNEAIAPYDPSHPFSSRLIGEEDFLFCFRLTDFGRQLLSRPYLEMDKLFARQPEPDFPYAQFSDEFTVQPNLEIVTPPDLALDRLYQLLLFSEIKKVDIMTTLTISRDSVRKGLDQGLTADSILELLRACSRKELPETISQIVGECQTRHGEIDIGLAGGFLVVSDRLRLEELKANPKIAAAIKDVFDDKLVLLSRTADIKKVARELQRLGYMPRIDSESLYVTNEGLFQVTLRAEELYDLLAVLQFAILMEEETGATVFEDRVRPIIQRLSASSQERFNPKFYAESIAKAFFANYEKLIKKLNDEATLKYRKQVNRMINQLPRKRAAVAFKGSNPAREAADIVKLIKHAIEHETEVRIHYQRSTGEEIDETIEPESLQGKKVYAYCPTDDEHHIYNLERVHSATI